MNHHELGMSRWTPWSVCPHFDGTEGGDYARIGTEQHEKLCRLLNGDDTLVLDETNALDRAVKWAADEIENSGLTTPSELYTEEKVEITSEVSEELSGIYGTCDAYVVARNLKDGTVSEIHIFDFKSLGRNLDSSSFSQLSGYALGVASSMHVKNMDTKVVLHLLLGGSFSHHRLETCLSECKETGESVVGNRKMKDFSKKTPSKWCKYCKHASSCASSTDLGTGLLGGGDFMSLDVCHRLVYIDNLMNMLAKAKEECREEISKAEGRMIDAGDVAYAIKEQAGRYVLEDGKMLELYGVLAENGVSLQEILDKCSIKKTDAMKLLQKRGFKLKSKNPSEATAETLVSGCYKASTVEKLERIK